MTFDEFIAKYKGKFVDFDGAFPNQCVDLTKAYNNEVVGGPSLMGNAKDYANNPLPNFYEYFINHLWYIPRRGSIAVWNGNVGGGFGHVGIVLEANVMRFRSLDQNWPTGSPVSEVDHDYKNVSGFLVPRLYSLDSQYNLLIDELRRLINRFPKQNIAPRNIAFAI